MYLSRFSTWMFELEISITRERMETPLSANPFIVRLLSSRAAFFPQRLFVERHVLPRRGFPREVLRHPPGDDRLPPRPVGVGGQRARDGLPELARVVAGEL